MERSPRNISVPFFLAVSILAVQSSAATDSFSWIDSATSDYSYAAGHYDSTLLKNTAEFIHSKPAAEQKTPRALLLIGLVYWRMELIAYCLNNSENVANFGKTAIEKFDAAEKAGENIYLTASHKALVCQLLAGQSISKGAVFGPRAALELRKARTANPQGYYSRLVEAINANQAPSFAGGNHKKAAVLLEKMTMDFPDSIDVKIHLADAYGKVGRPEDARGLIGPIIMNQPFNLLAKKIAKLVRVIEEHSKP